MPLPDVKCVADLLSFTNDAKDLDLAPDEAWEPFWKQVSTVVAAHLSLSNPAIRVEGHDRDAAKGAADALLVYLATKQDKEPLSDAVANVIGMLTDYSLDPLRPDVPLRELVGKVLEKIQSSEYEGNDRFYGALLLNCVQRTLDPKATLQDVSRLYKHRSCLTGLDWEDESIDDLKYNLLNCVMNGQVHRAQEGPALIAFLFNLHANFVPDVHACIKNQVHVCKSHTLGVFATAYYKAWRQSQGGVKLQIENAIQECIYWAVYLKPIKAVKCRQLLAEFHTNKDSQVGEMLERLYAPILWRNLKVANWEVRLNATALLCMAFPVVDPNLTVAQHEEAMQRQYQAFLECLHDNCDEVRKSAVTGICRVLHRFWEMIPPGVSSQLIAEMLDRNVKDKTSPKVRAAVPEGLVMVLQNPLTHAALSAVLDNGTVGHLIFDKHPLVRMQFAKLLRQINNIKDLSIFKIVTQDDLLAELAREHESSLHNPKQFVPMAQVYASLVLPSMFQQNNTDLPGMVKRCIYVATKWPSAFIAVMNHCKSEPIHVRIKLGAALFMHAVKKLSMAANASNVEDISQVVASEPWKAQLPLTLIFLRAARILLETEKSHGPQLEKFIREHVKEEIVSEEGVTVNVFALFALEFGLRAPLSQFLAVVNPEAFPKMKQWLCESLRTNWAERKMLGAAKNPEVWALVYLGHAWKLLQPLEASMLGNIEEFGVILLEHEKAALANAPVPQNDVSAERVQDFKQSIELVGVLLKKKDMEPPAEVREKLLELVDSVGRVMKASAARVVAQLAESNGAPLALPLLGAPPALRELWPELLAALGHAALYSEDEFGHSTAAVPLQALTEVFCDEDVVALVKALRACPMPDGAKKAKLEWGHWKEEAGATVLVLQRTCRQIIVASLAGEIGLTDRLPGLCEQMIAWGQATDWLARLAGEESAAGAESWKCGAKLVEQLCATKPTAELTCELADKVLMHASVEGVQPLATFLLKKLEHNTNLHDLIRRREKWPVPIRAVVENLAVEFPGVMRLVFDGPPALDADAENGPAVGAPAPPEGGVEPVAKDAPALPDSAEKARAADADRAPLVEANR